MRCRNEPPVGRATTIMLGRNNGPPVEHFPCHSALDIMVPSRIYYPHTYMDELEAHFQQIAEGSIKI